MQWILGGVRLYGFLMLGESKCPITTLRNRVVFVLNSPFAFVFSGLEGLMSVRC
ncbi:hypothetical protein J2Y39_002227 [Pseudomonas sp. 2957]|jgi:hypothetical protein|nr:hypothetical protein [Pseudomonas sp. 2957]